MPITLNELEEALNAPEDEHLEFKEAKRRLSSEDLTRYCAALANELGGRMILGVTDKPPRRIVGSSAFQDLGHVKARLTQELRLRVDACELYHSDGRVIVFDVPSRPLGQPVGYKGAYWMRRGGNLVPMTPDMLKRIFLETGEDFSAEICTEGSAADLHPEAVRRFCERWRKKSMNPALERLSNEQLLSDAELIVDDRITYAALIMMGTKRMLGKHLAQGEIIFEYRSNPASIPYQQRKEYREGFFLFDDELWDTINLRNEVQHFQDGLFKWDIPTFSQAVVREVILNAVAHRDYRLAGSGFVRQYPRRLEVVSPGGFPAGITPDNILDTQAPRNRRIAETLARRGLVERSGQGMNLMFEESIKEGKCRPDFTGSDDYQVWVTLECDIQDPRFLQFLEKVGGEKQKYFHTRDFVVLDLLRREEPVPEVLLPRLQRLRDLGVVELVSRRKYILSRSLYGFLGKKGVYTRKRGLDREKNKELLLKHIRDNRKTGSPLSEFFDIFPESSRHQIQGLLRELKREGKVYCVGVTRGARWYLGPSAGIA